MKLDPSKIKGLIYDLDGTLISTTSLHERAWVEAGKKAGIEITSDFLLKQKGMTNEAAAALIVPNEKILELVIAKSDYASQNAGKVTYYTDFDRAYKIFVSKNLDVWICTSADKRFVDKILIEIPTFPVPIDKIIHREMYINGKPSPEPILMTCEKMGLKPEETVYIGDAYNDNLAATAASSSFVYFLRDERDRDNKIPKDIPTISDHTQLVSLLSLN